MIGKIDRFSPWSCVGLQSLRRTLRGVRKRDPGIVRPKGVEKKGDDFIGFKVGICELMGFEGNFMVS